ncbi:hypothetical protein ACOMHN_027802 [Nucella lapillus]
MASLWTQALLLVVSLCGSLATAFNVTFEESEGVEEWRSHADSVFHLGTGRQFSPDDRFPYVDATLGTPDGHFVVAVGYSNTNENRFLYSVCLIPTGPRCALHFDAWMPPRRRGSGDAEGGDATSGGREELFISTMTFCHYCSNGMHAKEIRELPYVVTNVREDGPAGGRRRMRGRGGSDSSKRLCQPSGTVVSVEAVSAFWCCRVRCGCVSLLVLSFPLRLCQPSGAVVSVVAVSAFWYCRFRCGCVSLLVLSFPLWLPQL